MKNLVNCKPSEFIKQTSKIKKSVEKWLTDTDILNIRKNLPELKTAPSNATLQECKETDEYNKKALEKQSRENMSRILDAMLDQHPEETLEVLALICFVEPKDVDKHTMGEYIASINEMMEDEAVMGFFTSLMKLGRMNTTTV